MEIFLLILLLRFSLIESSSYKISNMILDDKCSFSAKGKANIENSVIENFIVTSNSNLALRNSTIKRSNISGYTEISDVFILDEIKREVAKIEFSCL